MGVVVGGGSLLLVQGFSGIRRRSGGRLMIGGRMCMVMVMVMVMGRM